MNECFRQNTNFNLSVSKGLLSFKKKSLIRNAKYLTHAPSILHQHLVDKISQYFISLRKTFSSLGS